MKKHETLQRIARYLMLHSSHRNNIGLLNGKMGIAIFFFHYADYTAKNIYNDFAGELINELYKEIHLDFPCDFKNGLSGIAWGIEYLVRNQFVEGETDEILEDLDLKILERDVRRIQDNTLDTGLKGLAYYVISRCANRERRNNIISEEYIIDLMRALDANIDKDDENTQLIKYMKCILSHQPIIISTGFMENILEKTRFRYKSLFEIARPLGISNNGYAGIGLKIIKKDETKSIYI